MKYLVRKSYVDIIGTIWLPAVTCAQRINVDSYDIENMRDDDGAITRDSVEQWLTSHSGDFQCVDDFSASIADGAQTIDIDWWEEESEFT